MIIYSLIDYLEEKEIGVVNETIFVGQLPFDKSNIISVMYSPSADSNPSLNVYEQTVDIYGRFTDSQVGYQKMLDIFNLFRAYKNYEIDGFHIYFSLPLGAVNDNDRDVKSRKLYSLSTRFRYRLLTEVS